MRAALAVRSAETQEVLGMLTPTVLCWAEDQETLETRVRALQTVLFHEGLVVRVEEAGLQALPSLPRDRKRRLCSNLVRTWEHRSVWAKLSRSFR